MPQGGVDEGEEPRSAAIREPEDRFAEIIAEVLHHLCIGTLLADYDCLPHVREKLRHQWGSDWKGQAHKWFLLKLTGSKKEINLLGDGTEEAVFGKWSWMSLNK